MFDSTPETSMQDERIIEIEISGRKAKALLAAILLAVLLLGVFIGLQAAAQEPAEPAKYSSDFTVEYQVTDIAKLEAKAIEIIRRKGTVTGEQVTLAEARAIVRPNGVTDVALCWEYVSTDRLRGIVQAKVTGVRISRPQT